MDAQSCCEKCPETGKLEEVCSQPWAKELGLSTGSRRISGFRTDSVEADGSLSDSAKTISDLQLQS